MRGVLPIAVLLRFMDSFMIYTEPFVVTGGGPGNSTTFLSIDLVKMALGQFDLGTGGGLLDHLLPRSSWSFSYVFYPVMLRAGTGEASDANRLRIDLAHRIYLICPAAADLLAGQHVVARQRRHHVQLGLCPHHLTFANYIEIFTDPSWYRGYINSFIYVSINTVISLTVALPAAYAFSRYRFLGDKHLFFWLLTNRMAPPAVFLLPFFQLYSALGLFDTHLRGGAGPLPVQRAAGGVDPGRLHVRRARARSTRPPSSTATRCRASSSRSSCR